MKDIEFWSAAQLRTSFHSSPRRIARIEAGRFRIKAFEALKAVFRRFRANKDDSPASVKKAAAENTQKIKGAIMNEKYFRTFRLPPFYQR